MGGAPDPGAKRGFHPVWQSRNSGANKIELDVVEVMNGDGVERLFESRAVERFGKNSQFHTAPVTSASLTSFLVSTERAIATSARIAAMPSSSEAPCCGAPFRIVSAKPSICSL